MHYYRYDLDQITAVLDLTACALSILSTFIPSSPFLSIAISHLLSLALLHPFYLLSQAG